MAKHLLPSLKTSAQGGHNVQEPSPGQWNARSAQELENISQGLIVNQVEVQVNSIPDVWARPLLFEMALFSPEDKENPHNEHPLRKQIIGEWRGLLAMLALREVKKLSGFLEAKKVEVKLKGTQNFEDQQSEDIEPIPPAKGANPVFLEALCKLIPQKTISSDTKWEHLYVFLFKMGHQTRPIGMSSPTTLVCTPTSYFNHIDQNKIPWFDGKILQDPVNYLNKQQRTALAGWLDLLSTNIKDHPQQLENEAIRNKIVIDKIIRNSLFGLLNQFKTDLNVSVTPVPGTHPMSIEKESGVFYYLNLPADTTTAESDVMLIQSKNRKPKTPMLLVDKDIKKQWGSELQDITVSGSATLADIPANGVVSRHKVGPHQIDTAELWKPQELFTEKLFVIRGENAFPGARQERWLRDAKPQLNSQPISIILPIAPELLEYLNEDDLLERLRFEQNTNGDIIVNLRVTLGKDTERDYEIKKTYSANEIKDFDQVPIIEVFPNFEKESWKAYYVAYSADNPASTFQIKPYSSASKNLEENQEKEPNWTWEYNASVEDSKIPIGGNATGERQIWRLESFPNVITCSAKDEKGKNQNAGLLLLEPTQKNLPLANRNFTVGVDFGASGTSVYKSADKLKEPLKFENRKLTVSLPDTNISQIFDFFFPPRNFEIPFLSIFQDFNNQKADEYLPIVNGHIYFVEDKKLPKNIFTNLKWRADETQYNHYAESFLAQICLQTAAELVLEGASKIDWRFSYPTAFNTTQLSKFNGFWKNVIASTKQLTGVESGILPNMTESIAAALFFRDDERKEAKAPTEIGTVFVDIGSSTSDISVWQGNVLWQTSLRYAGQDILLEFFRKNPDILRELNVSPDILKELNVNLESSEHFYAQIDAILRKDSKEIYKRLPRLSKESSKKLITHLALSLSGLFFYIGLGINCLRKQEENAYKKPEMPHFYFGGNGSQIFRWLIDGEMWHESALARLFESLFESIFSNALSEKLNGHFKLETSNLPKQEAAFGLVCNKSIGRQTEKNEKVFAGEFFMKGNVRQRWNEDLKKAPLTDVIQPTAKLEKLSEFVKQFNYFAEHSEGLFEKFECNDKKMDLVRGNLANTLADLAREKANNKEVMVQPIFILALKHLLKG
jgi:hypothetical protein